MSLDRQGSDPNLIWPRAVIFDLDGTLVDSAPDIAAAVNAGFGPLGIAPFPVEQVIGMIGGGASVAIGRAARSVGITLSRDDEAAVLARFLETYARVSADGRGLYPGAHELLGALRAEGRGMALCTNKAEHITHITIEALGIAGYFTSVVAARDDTPKKPDPAMVLKALAPFGVKSADAVMIGDSHADIEAARAAGVRSIAVTYGYSSTPARELGADHVIASLGEVRQALAAMRGLVGG